MNLLKTIIAVAFFIVAIFATISGFNKSDPSCAEIAARLLIRNEVERLDGSITISMSETFKPMLVRGIVKSVTEWLEYMWKNCGNYSIVWNHSEGVIVIGDGIARFFLILACAIFGSWIVKGIIFPKHPPTMVYARV